MMTGEVLPLFGSEKMSGIRMADFPDANRVAYRKYLENRVFAAMDSIPCWGINNDTLKWFLFESLTEEAGAQGVPFPYVEDLEAIFRSCWNVKTLKLTHFYDEVESFRVADSDKQTGKEMKGLMTAPSCVASDLRSFTDFGADIDVLLLVAHGKDNLDPLSVKLKSASGEFYSKKCPTLAGLQSDVKIVKLLQERQENAFLSFNEEDIIGPDNWDFFEKKQARLLSQNDFLKPLREKVFECNDFADGDKQGSESSGMTLRTRKTSISSLSSSESRPTVTFRTPKSSGGNVATPKTPANRPNKRSKPSVSCHPMITDTGKI